MSNETNERRALQIDELDGQAVLELPEREVMRWQLIGINIGWANTVGIQICQYSICQFNQF